MGLLDERAPEWNAVPANDPQYPWVGLLAELLNRPPPPQPEGTDSRFPDAYPYVQRIPPGAADDRAYRPTLRYEDSAPGMREAEAKRRMRLRNYNADTFRQPKTAEEIGLPPMTAAEKLQLLLQQYLPGMGR
jgi:hypothetical protein